MKKLLLSSLVGVALSCHGATNSLVSSNTVYSMIQLYGAGSNYVNTMMTVIQPNATTATIQSAINAGGAIWFIPSSTPYTITTNVSVTNGVTLYGNGSRLLAGTGLTNFMIDTGTNTSGGAFVLDGFKIDGGVRDYFAGTSNLFRLQNGTPTIYYNPYYSNRSGIRLSSSSGGVIRNCEFYGWPGQGLMLVNPFSGANAHYNLRVEVINNSFYSNFCGMYTAGSAYETEGYYNNSAPWKIAAPEYNAIRGNKFYRNYLGYGGGTANCQFQNNFVTGNQIGAHMGAAITSGMHGIVANNTINHNLYGLWCESAQAGPIRNNDFLANVYAGFIGGSVTELQLVGNWFGGPADTIIVTNVSTGFIADNFYQGTWAAFAPNITNKVAVYGNKSSTVVGDSDGGGIIFGTNYNATLFNNTNWPKLVSSNKVLYYVTNTKTNLDSNGE